MVCFGLKAEYFEGAINAALMLVVTAMMTSASNKAPCVFSLVTWEPLGT